MKKPKASPYQKELRVRVAIASLVGIMNDNRLDSKLIYQVIGQLTQLGTKLKKERK